MISARSLLVGLLAWSATAAATPDATLFDRLVAQAPGVSTAALKLALESRDCAAGDAAVPKGTRLAVIDYSRPSTEPRLWVFDLADEPRLLFAEHVAHGSGSGENLARTFSNDEGSHQSSLGLFLTAETYQGGNGYSLRLDGLEVGVNDKARERAIVMHGAPYVEPAQARRQGRLGRSFGCPAVRVAVAQSMIDTLREGQLLFAYYPDAEWLATSRFLGCGASQAGSIAALRAASPGAAPAVAEAGAGGGVHPGGGAIGARPKAAR